MPTDAKRILMHSEEAERGVLGSILMDFRAMDVANDYKLTEDSFYVPAHREIFKAITELYGKSSFTDRITLSEYLEKNKQLERVGGYVFLDKLIDDTPTAAHCENYVAIVAEKWRLRSIVQECRDTEQLCFNNKDIDADSIIVGHAANLMEIEGRQQQQEISWSDTVNESMERIENLLESNDKLSGFSTGYLNIDRAVLGLKPRELTILAARPSQGKTSLAMNIVEYVASGSRGSNNIPRPVGVFSLEMGREELALRMKCSKAAVDIWQLMRGFLPKSETEKLKLAAFRLSTLKIMVDDRAGLDIDQISIKARQWKKKHDVQLIVVDYLQLIHCIKVAKQGRQIEVSTISARLKQIAKELQIPVLALAQLSRKPEDRKDGRPMLSDLRESGSIEQDADNVWLLYRPCKYPGHPEAKDESLAIVEIAKQRSGPTGEARLNFRKEFTRFDDRAETEVTNETGPTEADLF